MKCTNKRKLIVIVLIMASLLTACSAVEFKMPFSLYQEMNQTTSHSYELEQQRYQGFAQNLCVIKDGSSLSANDLSSNSVSTNDVSGNTPDKVVTIDLRQEAAGVLIDINKKEALFSQDPYKRMYPASITKLLTAIVALKYSKPEDLITCDSSVSEITTPGAVLLNLHSGDQLTMDQALHLCLIQSYNDAAVAIANHVAGSVENFALLMNEEAKSLGATQSNFVNPSGLPDTNHYSCAYDIYLIFNEAIKYPEILETIQCKEYNTIYHDKSGKEIAANALSTNQYFWGTYEIPTNINIIGGKTGTTTEAGSCIAMLCRDQYSNPYIAVILNQKDRNELYKSLSEMFTEIVN